MAATLAHAMKHAVLGVQRYQPAHNWGARGEPAGWVWRHDGESSARLVYEALEELKTHPIW